MKTHRTLQASAPDRSAVALNAPAGGRPASAAPALNRASHGSGRRSALRPLTERLLAQLGGPRRLWVGLWGAAPLLQIGVVLAGLEVGGRSISGFEMVLVSQAVIAYVVLLLIWGTGRLLDQAASLQPELIKLTGRQHQEGLLSGLSTLAPLYLTAILVVLSTAFAWFTAGPVVALMEVPLLILTVWPIMTFVHTYLALLLRLDRLGRHRLSLEPFPQDRSLGLAPVGSLAYTGFWLVFAAVIPVIVTTSGQDLTALESYAVLGGVVSVFFPSMWRLHRQMAAAKAGYLEQARTLYASAYAPLRADASVDTLRSQAPVLGAAHELEERAASLLTWPIGDQLFGILIFVVAGVASGLIVRFALAAVRL